jgi:hypothetical protein
VDVNVRELLDLEALKKLKHRYFRSMDAKDWSSFADLFTDDAECLFALPGEQPSPPGATRTAEGWASIDRDGMVEWITASSEGFTTVHLAHMPDLVLTGPDTATGRWTMTDLTRWDATGDLTWYRSYGSYVDDYVRTEAGWRIRRTLFERHELDPFGAPDRVGVLERQVGELRDIEAIKQLKSRYIRMVDTQDWDGWRETMADHIVQVTDMGVVQGREEIIEAVSEGLAGGSIVHHTNAPEIELTGPDTARGTWATEDLVRVTVGGAPLEFHGHGHYHDEFVRTPDGWRVVRSEETRLRVDHITA